MRMDINISSYYKHIVGAQVNVHLFHLFLWAGGGQHSPPWQELPGILKPSRCSYRFKHKQTEAQELGDVWLSVSTEIQSSITHPFSKLARSSKVNSTHLRTADSVSSGTLTSLVNPVTITLTWGRASFSKCLSIKLELSTSPLMSCRSVTTNT